MPAPPARKGETERPGSQFFKPLRQIIEAAAQACEGATTTFNRLGLDVTGLNDLHVAIQKGTLPR